MTTLHVEEAGDPGGQPMLLVHGFLSSTVQWRANVERLGARHRLVLVDLPGHGRSPAPDDESAYGHDAVLAAFETIRREAGIERWWVCGQSLGGAVAMRYVLRHPEVSRGLVFTNSRAAFGLGRRGAGPRARATDGLASLRELPIHPIHATRFPSTIQDDLVAAADAMTFHAVDHVVTHRHDWCSIDDMHRLQLPVLLVNGRWERLFQPCVEQARATIADLEVVDLEGGHSINIEQPEGFDRAVLDFTSRRR